MVASKVIISVFLLLASVSACFACMCAGDMHPQDQFCRSKFAVKVLVLSQRIVDIEDGNVVEASEKNYYRAYREMTVRVLKTYKGDITEHALNKIYTAFSESVCGTRLKDGHYYFLMGYFGIWNKMSPSLCDYRTDITHMNYLTTRLLAENLLRNWERGCGKCRFVNISSRSKSVIKTAESCFWSGSEDSGMSQTLSYCAPNKRGSCRLWQYDVDSLGEGKGRFRISR